LKGLGYRADVKPATEIEARIDAIDAAYAEAEAEKAEEKRRQAAMAEAGAQAGETGTVAEMAADETVAGETVGGKAEPQEGTLPAPAVDAAGSEDVSVGSASPVEVEAQNLQAEPEDGASNPEAGPADIGSAPVPDAVSANDAEPDEARSPEEESSGEERAATAEQAAQETHKENAANETPAPGEPRTILLWRPVRHESRARPRHFHRGRNGGQAEGEASKANSRPEGKERFDRRFSGGGKGKPNNRHDGRQDRGDHAKGGGVKGKPVFGGRHREEKPKAFDPDSPFAKLAALREQLKK
jgi:ATP-dependent RNA helicase SUPV3L1/SUV3